MSKQKKFASETSVSLAVFIQDTSSTTGGGLSGVTSASSGLVMEYRRQGQSSWTTVTPVAGKVLGTYLSGGIIADGSLAGAYEVDFPDAAFATGARAVFIRIRSVANMLPVLIEVELDAVNYQDPTRFGLTALPNAAAGASGGLPTVDSANRVKANAEQIAGQATSASAPVAFPASVANETTVASRATQTSVDAIPTNPLLTTDTRLNNLNAPISSIPTNPLLTTDSRLNNLNAPISAIPTNPLLTTDARLNFLDASIATSTSSILGAITGLNNLSAKCNLFGSAVLEAPETGSSVYEFTLVVNDDEGKLVNLDATPTVTATNSTGTNRSTNLSAVTNPSVGRYRFTYTVASTHPRENLRIECNGTTSTETRYAIWAGAVVDFDQSTVLAQIVSDLALKPTLLQIDSGTMAGNVTLLAQRLSEARAGYLDGVLLAQNFNQRVVHVTGSHNVGADLRESQPNSIHPTSLQTTVYNTLSANLLATIHTSYTTPGTVGKTLNDTNTSLSTLLTRIPTATAQLVTDLTTMLVGSGTALVKWTANALSLAPAGGGGGGGATSVTPEAFINLDNTLLEKNTLVFFNNESRTYLVTLAAGVFDGQPMTFCIERADKTTLTAVTGLTSITNAVSVTIPSIAPQTDNCMQWSLRDSATGRIILYGPAIQKYAAFNN